MRFFSTLVATLAVASGVSAVDIQKSIIVTYPQEVSIDIVNKAMNEIKSAGGMITHEYNLIKGFAAKAPQKVIDSVSAWGIQYNAIVEEDKPVEVSGNIL